MIDAVLIERVRGEQSLKRPASLAASFLGHLFEEIRNRARIVRRAAQILYGILVGLRFVRTAVGKKRKSGKKVGCYIGDLPRVLPEHKSERNLGAVSLGHPFCCMPPFGV